MKHIKKGLAWLLSCAMMLSIPFVGKGNIEVNAVGMEASDVNATTESAPTYAAENDFSDYTPISTPQELNAVRNDLSGKYYLTADIVFTKADFAEGGAFYNAGWGWRSIGSGPDDAFTGVFDGNGHTINGLYVNISGSGVISYAGLFGYNKGIIRNVGSLNGSISVATSADTAYAGGIAAYNNATISNCYNTGSISVVASTTAYAGGIVGNSYYGAIINGYNVGSVYASATMSRSYAYAGGIVGYNYVGPIANCYDIGSVNAVVPSTYSSAYAGGVAGTNENGVLENCYYLDTIRQGVGNGTDTSIPCAEEKMREKDTFVGFDFEKMWEFVEENSYPYPTLKVAYADEPEEDASEFAGGTGTSYDPYLIAGKMHLNNVRYHLGAYFKMIDDVEFHRADFVAGGVFYNDTQGWQPIDDFFGVFDGNGHTIKGLYSLCGGVFSDNNGIIRNLGLLDSSITAASD